LCASGPVQDDNNPDIQFAEELQVGVVQPHGVGLNLHIYLHIRTGGRPRIALYLGNEFAAGEERLSAMQDTATSADPCA
jgi:hypothetical protein